MVARKSSAESGATRGMKALLAAWQATLSRALGATGRAARGLEVVSRPDTAGQEGAPVATTASKLPLATGALAVLVGTIVAVAVPHGNIERLQAASASVVSAIWAIGRWIILRRSLPAEKTAAADASSGWGMVPWAVAWSPELRFGAWVVSAILTWLLLERRDITRREALVAIGRAWGAHAAFTVVWILMQNAVVILLAMRS